MKRTLLGFLLLSLPQAVCARGKTWEQLKQKALSEGAEEKLHAPFFEKLGVDWASAEALGGKEQSADGMDRIVYLVVVDESSTTPVAKEWVFSCRKKDVDIKKALSFYFRTSLDGKLLRVVSMSSDFDVSGKPIVGSGRIKEEDVNSAEVKKRFKHELDFWLRGKYHKKSS